MIRSIKRALEVKCETERILLLEDLCLNPHYHDDFVLFCPAPDVF